jgi:hypothetical protein
MVLRWITKKAYFYPLNQPLAMSLSVQSPVQTWCIPREYFRKRITKNYKDSHRN